MQTSRLFTLSAFLLFALLLIPQVALAHSIVEQDRVRITEHLIEVETELRARDASHLTEELQAERLRNLERLHQYRQAGEYPRNTYVPGVRPVFIDADDRLCAVGYLMVRSGWEEEARRISQRENLQYLLKMESPEVAAWVEQSGLTAEEAAWIQPGYSSCYDACSCDVDPVCGEDGRTYVNPCFAHKCGRVERWYHGCCEAGDQIESSVGYEYGFPQTACPNDPNHSADTYCPQSESERQVSESDWVDAADFESDGPFCAIAQQSPGEGLALLALLLGAMVLLRRRTANLSKWLQTNPN